MPVKKRTVVGGLLVVGAVLGTFMSGLLPGFGSGSGVGAQGPVNDSPNAVSRDALTEPAPVENPVVAKVETAPRPAVLEIRVDNHDYFVADNSSETGVRQVDLDEAVELAQAATGNDDGIRVRIVRSRSARLTAWTTLHDSLIKAELSMDSIRMPKDLVE
ncbi:MAG: hypothetical protein ACI8P0_000947 [Planctomycetaceae bacterium]|jgi:hypothetical protein